MTIGRYFKAKRKEQRLSLRNASKLSGISHVHVRDIENDRIKPAFEKVIKLLKAYNADIQDFLSKTGSISPRDIETVESEKLYKIPVFSSVVAEKSGTAYGSSKQDKVSEWIGSGIEDHRVFALRVRDDSMVPEFHEGEIIIVNPHIKPEHNDYVIVKNDQGEIAFKQLKKYGKTTVFHPLNPKYPDIQLSARQKYTIIGKVVKKEKIY
ncbi:MAG: helix-turn-helix domain-containing protein [Nitrospirae bacterium]|nr:helix-turn-helix domain-containing protein [Nitrospirota bacterium]